MSDGFSLLGLSGLLEEVGEHVPAPRQVMEIKGGLRLFVDGLLEEIDGLAACGLGLAPTAPGPEEATVSFQSHGEVAAVTGRMGVRGDGLAPNLDGAEEDPFRLVLLTGSGAQDGPVGQGKRQSGP